MEITFKGKTITLDKELTLYDTLAITFAHILHQQHISYVFVSGYVALLFGRSRVSEDIDMLVEHMSFEKFKDLWDALSADFYCHNASDAQSAYNEYLEQNLALRFSQKNMVIPNVEFKWAWNEQQKHALEQRWSVILNSHELSTSALELQIAFKIYLGSDKDIEDARYLFTLFREHLDLTILQQEIKDLHLSFPTSKKKLGW